MQTVEFYSLYTLFFAYLCSVGCLCALSYLKCLVRHAVTVSAGKSIIEDMTLCFIRSDRLTAASSRGSYCCIRDAKTKSVFSFVARVRLAVAVRCAKEGLSIEGGRYLTPQHSGLCPFRVKGLSIYIARFRLCLRPFEVVPLTDAKIRINFYACTYLFNFCLFLNFFLFIETLFYKCTKVNNCAKVPYGYIV